jgi:hypothetical protein
MPEAASLMLSEGAIAAKRPLVILNTTMNRLLPKI